MPKEAGAETARRHPRPRPGAGAAGADPDLLDVGDVLGRHLIETRLFHPITVAEAQSAAALEVVSRFAADPRWLIYLPPTMSPAETSVEPGLLEHPAEAFAYYRSEGVPRVVCEEKHMGSRAVLVVCRTAAVARARFRVPADGPDSGRRARHLLHPHRAALLRRRRPGERPADASGGRSAAGLWEALETDWLCIDAELMPWSVKAQGLLRQQFAAAGAAALAALPPAVAALDRAAARGDDGGIRVAAAAGAAGRRRPPRTVPRATRPPPSGTSPLTGATAGR